MASLIETVVAPAYKVGGVVYANPEDALKHAVRIRAASMCITLQLTQTSQRDVISEAEDLVNKNRTTSRKTLINDLRALADELEGV